MTQEKKSLYDLVVAAQSITAALIESGGELTPEIEESLNTNQLALATKVDAYAYIDEQMEAQAEMIKKREEILYRVRKGLERARERLKTNLKGAMNALEWTEAHGNEFKFKLSARPAKLVIGEESKIPDLYKYSVHTLEVDKEALRSALSVGVAIPGAHLEPVVALLKQPNLEMKK